MSVIDVASNTVVGSPIRVGISPFGIAITPDGATAYVANAGSKNVSVIDLATNTVVGLPIPVGSGPRAIAITPPSTPQEQIAFFLIDPVNALVAAGVLNQGQGSGLLRKLDAAGQALDRGNATAAINQLQAFINQVEAFINAGTLSPAEGQPLIDAAQAIIDALTA